MSPTFFFFFQRDEGRGWGRRGLSNVCVMSKKGIKIKSGYLAPESALCFTTGERRQIKAAEMKINKLG